MVALTVDGGGRLSSLADVCHAFVIKDLLYLSNYISNFASLLFKPRAESSIHGFLR